MAGFFLVCGRETKQTVFYAHRRPTVPFIKTLLMSSHSFESHCHTGNYYLVFAFSNTHFICDAKTEILQRTIIIYRLTLSLYVLILFYLAWEDRLSCKISFMNPVDLIDSILVSRQDRKIKLVKLLLFVTPSINLRVFLIEWNVNIPENETSDVSVAGFL